MQNAKQICRGHIQINSKKLKETRIICKYDTGTKTEIFFVFRERFKYAEYENVRIPEC